MSEHLTLELPDDLARRARDLAAATNRRFEDAVVEWIGRAVSEPDVEFLPDAQVLALCDARLDVEQQDDLSSLLAGHREQELSQVDRDRLDNLLGLYRRRQILKAHALKEAVARGLRSRLDGDAP